MEEFSSDSGLHHHPHEFENQIYCRFLLVGKAVPGERRIWKTAEDPKTTSPVMSGISSKSFAAFNVQRYCAVEDLKR